MPRGIRVSDWLPHSCGDAVVQRCDPRHVGRVEAIVSGAFVRVRWEGGFYSDLPLRAVAESFWDLGDQDLLRVYSREVHSVADDALDAYAQAVLDEAARRAEDQITIGGDL